MDSCPKELDSYDRAYKLKMQEQDHLMHLWWGTYGLSAVSVAVEHCLAGKKAKSKYVQDAVMDELLENYGLTQEEIDNKELQKMLLAEKQWQMQAKIKSLPETIMKKERT
jgi:hypothetical protein